MPKKFISKIFNMNFYKSFVVLSYNCLEIAKRKERVLVKENKSAQVLATDEEIIDMYWKRNPDAIQETDRKYGRLVKDIAYKILYDNLDCEECQNDTYLKIWNSIPSFKPPKFISYIIQLGRQISIDRYREKSRMKRVPSQLTISLGELESVGSGLSIEEIYEAKEVGKMISDYIRTLSERQRYIFMDRYYFSETIEKTAADLSISTDIAYREIRKIKQGLREYLERNGVHV
jgi:RNA polymerase sigma-70 factor (ECF subfamily)